MIAKRIRRIADLIEKQESVIDVGCDHGYLALALRGNGHKASITCSDNKVGPLDNARRNLSSYENIVFLLADGIDGLKEKTDVCVAAGMGSNTIVHILSNTSKAAKIKRFILQCNNNVDELRRWLADNHYRISDEDVVYERKYYEIICVEKGEMQLSDIEIAFGPCLLKKRNETFLNMLAERALKTEKILENLDKTHPDYLMLLIQKETIEKIIEG